MRLPSPSLSQQPMSPLPSWRCPNKHQLKGPELFLTFLNAATEAWVGRALLASHGGAGRPLAGVPRLSSVCPSA